MIFEWPSSMLQHSVNGGSGTQLPIFLLLCMAFALSAAVWCADGNHKPVRTWKAEESQGVPSKERRRLSLTPNALDEETADGVVGSIPFTDLIGLVSSVQDTRPVLDAKTKMHKDSYDPENLREVSAEDPGVIIAVRFIPVMDAVEQLAPNPFQDIKSHRHFVRIHWRRADIMLTKLVATHKLSSNALLSVVNPPQSRLCRCHYPTRSRAWSQR